jgi:hypothetical protein
MTPAKRITDEDFVYVNSARTDIRERFRKLGWKPPSEKRAPVVPIKKARP